MRLNLGTLTADAAADAAAADRARELLEAARRRAEAQLLLRCAGWTTLRLAELAIAGGEPDRAAGLLDAALAHLRPLGDRWGVARALELDRAAAKGSLSPARER
jgi:hypothetical protein